MKEFRLGRVAGLTLSAMPSAVVGLLVLWVLLAAAALGPLALPPLAGILGSLMAVLLHLLSELSHNLGHAWAARRGGHPMTGVRFWGVLATSVYPADEPALPASVHIARAWGGPAGSLVLALLAGVCAWLLWPMGGAIGWVALFAFLDNLVIYTLGALLPMGFTDGSTLLRWRTKRSP